MAEIVLSDLAGNMKSKRKQRAKNKDYKEVLKIRFFETNKIFKTAVY